MEELIFKSDPAFLEKLGTQSQKSFRLLCPVCQGDVMYAPDWKRARELTVHPGAYCTVDRRHLTVMFDLAPERLPVLPAVDAPAARRTP